MLQYDVDAGAKFTPQVQLFLGLHISLEKVALQNRISGESEFQRKAHEQGARTMKLIVEIIKDMPTAAIDALKFFVEGMVKFVTTPIGQRVE